MTVASIPHYTPFLYFTGSERSLCPQPLLRCGACKLHSTFSWVHCSSPLHRCEFQPVFSKHGLQRPSSRSGKAILLSGKLCVQLLWPAKGSQGFTAKATFTEKRPHYPTPNPNQGALSLPRIRCGYCKPQTLEN